MEGNFQHKMTKIKQNLLSKDTGFTNENVSCNARHHCTVEVRGGDETRNRTSREELCIQQPVIIQKKNTTVPSLSRPQSAKRLNTSNV